MSTTSWKEIYEATVTESDAARLSERIQRARTAILDRVDQLLEDREHQPEHDDILNALHRLDVLARRT